MQTLAYTILQNIQLKMRRFKLLCDSDIRFVNKQTNKQTLIK